MKKALFKSWNVGSCTQLCIGSICFYVYSRVLSITEVGHRSIKTVEKLSKKTQDQPAFSPELFALGGHKTSQELEVVEKSAKKGMACLVATQSDTVFYMRVQPTAPASNYIQATQAGRTLQKANMQLRYQLANSVPEEAKTGHRLAGLATLFRSTRHMKPAKCLGALD